MSALRRYLTAAIGLALLASAATAEGGAMFFDGVNDVLNYGDQGRLQTIDTTTALTVCFSLHINATKNQEFIAKTTSRAANGWGIGTGVGSNNDLNYIMVNQTGRVVNGAIADGTTNRWCIVWDGAATGNAGRLHMYKNGLAQAVTFSGTIPATISNPGVCSLCIGNEGAACGTAGLFAAAAISHVRIWTTAFNSDEVAADRFSYIPTQHLDTLVFWAPLDDGKGANNALETENLPTVTGAVPSDDPTASDPNIVKP